MADLYSDIYEYLDDYGTESSSYLDGLEELVGFVRAYLGTDKDKAEIIINSFIIEIKNAMLRGDIVLLKGFGKLYCGGTRLRKGRSKLYHISINPKFKAAKSIYNKLNEHAETK
jgi:nucleoid DNA-binding protein